ncbi:DUF6025 family protein [Kitasatospora sp. NPDC058190]|uniref:DUF6025 family protein n=1 Tax=Kitasatospora sp. NPDC058190 TaxID=3346371 RepID=UPI0036DE67E4
MADDTRCYAKDRGSRFISFLDESGLFDATFGRPRFTRELFERVAERKQLFVGINPGGTDLQVGRLLDAIRGHDWLRPVRSGHAGNWAPIWSGRAPLLAYNRAATADLGVGRPVIHALVLTETADLTKGDTIYRPGSLYRDGELHPLDLAAPADRGGWRELSREVPRFVPWTWAELDGGRVNLADLHCSGLRADAPVPVLVEAELIWRNAGTVRGWLVNLLEKYGRSAFRGELTPLFGRGVGRDAAVCAIRVRVDGGRYLLSGDNGATWQPLGGAEELADLCLLPYRVVAEPAVAEQLVRSAPAITPLLSNRLSSLISAYLGVATTLPPDELAAEPFALMVEWGALAQGGYPPMRRGYFASRSNQRAMRGIVGVFAAANRLPPLVHVMLPLAPLILLPSTAEPVDADHLAGFFAEVGRRTAGLGDTVPFALERAGSAYQDWGAAGAVSDFYRSKFSGARSVETHGSGADTAFTIETSQLRELTLRQAGLTAATLFGAWKA